MRKEYENELSELRKRMEGAETFATTLPHFEGTIISNKYDGTEDYIRFGEKYDGMPFPWGISRGRYRDGTGRMLLNYGESSNYDEYLFSLYINTLVLYDSHNEYGLEKIADDVDVFYYDNLNSTFYATDDQIMPLLDSLSEWYQKAKAAAQGGRESNRRAELLAEQERIASELEKLG